MKWSGQEYHSYQTTKYARRARMRVHLVDAAVVPEQEEFPQWNARQLTSVLPMLDTAGLELLHAMLQYDPSRRITARAALQAGRK